MSKRFELAMQLLDAANDKKYADMYKNIYIAAVVSVIALLVVFPYVKE